MEHALNSTRVKEIVEAAIYEEIPVPLPEGVISVEGIMIEFVFRPEVIEKYRQEIRDMAVELPKQFFDVKNGGEGGWSFLEMCNDYRGEQWTGLHMVMEGLCALIIGAGYGEWLLPRPLWQLLPGGMPYIVIYPNGKPEGTESAMSIFDGFGKGSEVEM